MISIYTSCLFKKLKKFVFQKSLNASTNYDENKFIFGALKLNKSKANKLYWRKLLELKSMSWNWGWLKT